MLKLVNCRNLALKMGNDHAIKVLKIQIKVSTKISFLNYFVSLVTPCAVGNLFTYFCEEQYGKFSIFETTYICLDWNA